MGPVARRTPLRVRARWTARPASSPHGKLRTAARSIPSRFGEGASDTPRIPDVRGLSSRGRRDREGVAGTDATDRPGRLCRVGAGARRRRAQRLERHTPDVGSARDAVLGPGRDGREIVLEADSRSTIPRYGTSICSSIAVHRGGMIANLPRVCGCTSCTVSIRTSGLTLIGSPRTRHSSSHNRIEGRLQWSKP